MLSPSHKQSYVSGPARCPQRTEDSVGSFGTELQTELLETDPRSSTGAISFLNRDGHLSPVNMYLYSMELSCRLLVPLSTGE